MEYDVYIDGKHTNRIKAFSYEDAIDQVLDLNCITVSEVRE